MKTKFYLNWKAVLVLAGLPLVAAALQGPPADEPKPGASVPDVAALTAMAEMPGGQLATNQAEAVSATNARPSGPMLPNLQLYGGTAEIVKLAQSGVGEGVMLSYISNTPARFSLGSDQIIYLNDLGVSSSVVTAMIQHDAAQDAAGTALPPATSAYPSNQTYVATYPPDQPIPATGADYTDYNTYPPADYSTPDDSAYFYDTLAPYGSWISLPGYGLCWQPVVYVRNHDWRPYNDRGRWLYTDCGWYWHSDYSWGSTAFHYGRWFHDANTGWVWAPNRVWSPAWVSWRSSAEYTGWAPLPPSAHFVPGAGFRFQNHAVDASFEFGLHRSLYTFVPTERLADYSPGRYRITGAQSVGVFNQTAVINHFTTVNHQVVNHGVDPAQVEARSGAPIRRAVIRDLPTGSGNGRTQPDRLDKQGDSLVVFRPQLPATPGRQSGPASGVTANGNGGSPTGRRFETTSSKNSGAPNTTPVVSVASPNGTRPATGAPTLFGADRENKPRVEVYERHDPPPAGPTTITPAPARTTATANTGNPAVRGNSGATYPPNSLVIDGRRNLTDPQHAPPSSAMNAGSLTAQPGRTPSQTFTVYQRPDLSGSTPPPGAAPRVAMSQDGSSSQRFTVYERPDLSSNVRPDQGAGSHQLPARGNNDYSRGSGNQTSPSHTATQSGQSSSPSQAPVLLPSRGNGNYGYSQPANSSAPAYAPPAGRSAPAQYYNPQPQPVMLPPSHSQPAPAPAPAAPSHSAPAQSSQSSSSQSSSSQSSGRR